MPPLEGTKNKIYYGWIIVIVLLFIAMVLVGSRSSFGVFFKSLTDEFGLSRAATSSITSLFMLLSIFFTFAGGWALDRFGPRPVFAVMGLFAGLSLLLTSLAGSIIHLYLSYSVLFAIGTASFFTVINATVSKWFDRNRGLALGITNTGSRIGEATIAPAAALLITDFGWRIAYRIIAITSWIIIIPLSRLMKSPPREQGTAIDTSPANARFEDRRIKKEGKLSDLTFVQSLKSRNYWYFAPLWLCSGFGQAVVFTHIVPYATDLNISPVNAATILTIIGGISIPAGILIGRLIDSTGAKIPLIFLCLLQGMSILSLTWATDLWNFYLIASFFGISCAGMGISLSTLTAEAFGKKHLGTIMSSLDAAFAIGSAVGAFTAGLIHDRYGNYNLSFLISAAGLVLAVLLLTRFNPGYTSQEAGTADS